MSSITIKDMNNEVGELGWIEFCFKYEIRITHAQNIESVLDNVPIENNEGATVGNLNNDCYLSNGTRPDMIIEVSERFPPHTEAFFLLNTGTKSTMHTRQRDDSQIETEFNIHLCSLKTSHIHSMIKDSFQLRNTGTKKMSLIWGYTKKWRGEYYINKKDIQCICIEDSADRNFYLTWVTSMKASNAIAENASNSTLRSLKYKGFPLLLSRPTMATPHIYIDFLICLSNCKFENRRIVMLKK
jgi:hypothetical protein